jgi:hypothetical protein
VISSPRHVRSSILSGTVVPAFGCGLSIQARSSVAMRDCSVDSISSLIPSISTSSKAFRSRKLIGATT